MEHKKEFVTTNAEFLTKNPQASVKKKVRITHNEIADNVFNYRLKNRICGHADWIEKQFLKESQSITRRPK
jgi:hypothetical protein